MSEFFTPVATVIDAMRDGQLVVLMDDEDRENEGDLVVASGAVTKEHIAFMLNHARGLICVSVQKATTDRLRLLPQALNNTSPYTTAFLTPVDAKDTAASGVTAASRAATIRLITDEDSTHSDFVHPGNVFPLLAHEAGVFGRRGQTEGSADLARLAGFAASGVICELLSDSGTVLRGETLREYVKKFSLPTTTVEALRTFRIEHDISVRALSQHQVTNRFGSWTAHLFRDDAEQKEHVALVFNTALSNNLTPLVRVHSECITGDFLGSLRCDCGSQLQDGLAKIAAHGKGALVYLRQEGRGIGLLKKLEAYNLQDAGLDTVDANLSLGLSIDGRNYVVAARMLEKLGYTKIDLITNNPLKIEALEKQHITIGTRVVSHSVITPFNKAYLETKRSRMGHLS